tara:strand:- start:1461 stop:2063 length:603 start_codon:yes stop_codon:yes gene_type:complete
MITLTSHFTGVINIANTSSSYSEGEALAGFIAKYEPIFLKEILGYTLYNLFITNIADVSGEYYDLLNGAAYTDANDVATYWDGLNTAGLNPIANFIWVKYQEDLYLQNTSMGIMQVKGENMVNISPSYKIAKAWDEMVTMCWKMHDFITVNEADYPDYIGLTYAPYNKNLTSRVYNYNLLGNTFRTEYENNKYFQYRPRL